MVKINYKIIIFSIIALLFLGGNPVFALVLTETENVTISARVGSDPTTVGGVGGGVMGIPKAAIRFQGEAYPNAFVTIWENGIELRTIQADQKGFFDATLEGKYNNAVLYTLFAKDSLGNRSLLLNYPIFVYTGFITYISGIRFAPTLVTDKIEVKAGDFITVSGSALPSKNIEVLIKGRVDQNFSLISKEDGSYKITLPLLDLPKGDYSLHVNYAGDTRISKLIKFTIGDVNVSTVDAVANIPGDCNADKIINLVDFSVLAFWYGKDNPPVCVDTNRDNKINLVDFSILAFYWTG